MTSEPGAPAADHGGDLARARALFGGAPGAWLDLSTGINRLAYPASAPSETALRALPSAEAEARLIAAARRAYGAQARADIVAAPGAQAIIQALPQALLRARPERFEDTPSAAILGPTYNEHARAFRAAEWRVREIAALSETATETATATATADVLVVVRPNNPDGAAPSRDALRAAAAARILILDESFADAEPTLSLAQDAPDLAPDDGALIILRSFGKFYGLAGLRLGFALSAADLGAALRAILGPWAVSGPALEIGAAALDDADWAAQMRGRLAENPARLDAIGRRAGWTPLGGTGLFRLFETPDAAAAQAALASRRIWSRIFPYSKTWLRLGAPGPEPEWARLEAAAEAIGRA